VNSSKKESIESAKKKIVENGSTKYYLEYFFRHSLPYSTAITSCNSDQLSDMNLVHGVKFADIYSNCPSLSSKHALWRYLHTFYLLVQSYPKLDKIIEKYETHENIAKIKEALANHDDNLKNIMASSAKFAEDILKEQAAKQEAEAGTGAGAGPLPNLFEGMDEGKFEEKFMNSSIGNLAKEISQDLDLSDLQNLESPDDLMKAFMNGGSGGLGGIIQKVSSKLQTKLASGDLNEEALMKDATQMMGMLNPALQSMGLGGMGGGGKGGKGMEGMGNLFSMMGGLMGGGGGKKKKHSKKK
jgi:hypothetical protein